MEQKHTLEENGYYAQVTDQLIENIGYQMIRRNWSMKTLADKAYFEDCKCTGMFAG